MAERSGHFAALGIETEKKPPTDVVVTGYAQLTPLGDTVETFAGLLAGRSGIQRYDVGNNRVKIAGPVNFDPSAHFNSSEQRLLPRITQMAIVAVREALEQADAVDEDGKIKSEFDRDRVSSCVTSGVYATQNLISIYRTIHEEGPQRVRPWDGLGAFPEEFNAQVAIRFKAKGWPTAAPEACSSGAGAIAEGARLIKEGRADIVICGGFEEALYEYGEVAIAAFASMRNRVLSQRNDEPEKASRPFDKNRDGFVLSSGGGIVILEREDHALGRGARIYAKVAGFEKSMDGEDPTSMDVRRVAKTMAQALFDEKKQEIRKVDAIFAHATSTGAGDKDEPVAFQIVFGGEVITIPITAIKSMLGHLAGGAGAVNVVNAIMALNENRVPQILNLEEPEEGLEGFNFVRGKTLETELNTILCHASGFGGHNADIVLEKYRPA